MERNKKVEQEDVFVCEVCSKVCRSKAGLTNHRKRIHEVYALKKEFHCECGKVFKQEANLTNHRKHKCGAPNLQACIFKGDRGPCPQCGKEMLKTNISRHIKKSCPGGKASL